VEEKKYEDEAPAEQEQEEAANIDQ